jgi:hypothetical protein
MTIRVGKPMTSPDRPAHTKRVPMGNAPGGYEKQRGHRSDGRSTAQRSTGINPKMRDPIIPGMPNLSPP